MSTEGSKAAFRPWVEMMNKGDWTGRRARALLSPLLVWALCLTAGCITQANAADQSPVHDQRQFDAYGQDIPDIGYGRPVGMGDLRRMESQDNQRQLAFSGKGTLEIYRKSVGMGDLRRMESQGD